jgi:hypothetical protein
MGAWSLMSLLSRIKAVFSGTPPNEPATESHRDEHASRHDRREAGRERHHETGEPAWEASDRLDDPPGTGKKDPDAAPEILGGG